MAPGPYTGKPPRPPSKPEGLALSAAKLLGIFIAPILFMLAVVPTGYLLMGPGSSFDLQEGLRVEGAQTFASEGEFLLTSVRLKEAVLLYHLISPFNGGYSMLRLRDYLGEEMDVEGQDLVEEVVTILSENAATVVALREVGNPVQLEGLGTMVVRALEGYPAYGLLQPGEVIVSANGKPLRNQEELGAVIAATPAGKEVRLGVKGINGSMLAGEQENGAQGPHGRADDPGRNEDPDPADLLEEEERTVLVAPVWEEQAGKNVIGVALQDYFTYTSNVEVAWGLEDVRGPSAGLMMALSLINALTPDDLTGGRKIAGTGEILLDGDVGPIGGLSYKIRAAEAEGAEVFLYPVENQGELEGVSTRLELYPVDTLQDALGVLAGLD